MSAGGIDIAALRRVLPESAWRPQPWRVLVMFGHVVVAVACFWGVRFVPLWGWPLLVVLAGHSLLCVGLYSHDLTHGSIMARGRFRRLLEHVFWGINLISATVWRKVHNETHHRHYSTPADPDRQFMESEETAATRWYTRLLIPNRESVAGNPLVFVQLFFYTGRNVLAAFWPGGRRFSFVPAQPEYSRADLVAVCGDLLFMAVWLGLLGAVSGLGVLAFGGFAMAVYSVTSGLSMMYIFTNHALNPITDESDPLQGTTSVVVPKLFDRLHAHFSYHTEHHVFPALRPAYLPLVSDWLREKYPESYRRIPIGEAWRRLWQNRAFEPDPENGKEGA